ncbi:MAG TPA: HAD-IIIA family hydrolase [Tetrasphaera sp.]|uniref:D-glycero-alpha-D-manno-heptose-1,7-bisphosphate 7-phosphatase n=1 Tax=Nostocoides sp. TaxID=1917966 RepID=UPI002BCEA142|nr:HAD-IIIA family hydrolase [Tetrasphaera sp.]HNQ08364.1 HAD-IIIA family hydrolase [Tetrasphaera sp.]
MIGPAGARAAYDIVFLDRDGTINVREEGGYVAAAESVVLLPGAGEAIARLNTAGIPVVVVTNQRGLATGRVTWEQFAAVSAALDVALAAHGAHLDHTAVCPHDHDSCNCRKPLDGLFRQVLAAEPWAQPERCALVGDMPTDTAPARGLGMRALQLGVDVPDLAGAVEILLGG